MIILRNRGDNLFSQLTVELLREISEVGQNSDSDFEKAIKHVARGELSEVKAVLEEASRMEDKTKLKKLLLLSGTVVTRCGLIVKCKTLLECALGEGDREMIEMIKSYFPMFVNGKNEMEKQLERYRPCIEAMQNQKPEDLTWLFDIIKKSPAKDVLAELAEGNEYDVNYQSELRTALNKFREQKLDPKVRVITKPRMHCNYQNLRHAYDMLDALKELSDWDDYCLKVGLVSMQVIGWIQLIELPAYERYLFARGQVESEAAGKKIEVERNVNYKHGTGSFPDFDEAFIKSHSGLGFGVYSSISGLPCKGGHSILGVLSQSQSCVTRLMSNKNLRLAELMPQHPKPKTGWCMIV